VPLDLLGVVDVMSGAGLAMQAPGGLFEFVILPIWLIAKGFRSPVARSAEALPVQPVSAPQPV
jgi:hypothetical protein